MLSSSLPALLSLVLSVAALPTVEPRLNINRAVVPEGCGPGGLIVTKSPSVSSSTSTYATGTSSGPIAVNTGCPTTIGTRREEPPVVVKVRELVERLVTEDGCGPPGLKRACPNPSHKIKREPFQPEVELSKRVSGREEQSLNPREPWSAPTVTKSDAVAKREVAGCGGRGTISCDPIKRREEEPKVEKRIEGGCGGQGGLSCDIPTVKRGDGRGCGGQGGLSCDIPAVKRIEGCGGQGGLSCDDQKKKKRLEVVKRQGACGGVGRPSCDPAIS